MKLKIAYTNINILLIIISFFIKFKNMYPLIVKKKKKFVPQYFYIKNLVKMPPLEKSLFCTLVLILIKINYFIIIHDCFDTFAQLFELSISLKIPFEK